MTPTRAQVETLLRLRWVAIASIPGIIGGLGINAWLFPKVFAPQAMSLGLMLATELVCASLPRRASVARRAVPLAVVYTAVHGLGTLWLLTWSVNLDLAAGTLAALLTGVALLFPWGGATQVGVTLLFATSFAVVVPWSAWDDGRVLNILIQLAVGGIISVAGAVVIERQRAATERERAHTREVARQRAGMLVAAHELNATLDLETLSRRIVRVARTLIACDVSSLTLIDTRSGRVIPAAMDGDIGATGQSLVGVVFTDGAQSPYVQELLTHLASRGTVEVPGGTSLDGPVHAVLQHFGIARALFVAIRREGRVLGYMSFNRRHAAAGFDAQDLRLAEGLAQSAAIALDNARLVDDLQRAGRLKSEFVSTMSHELRTPLNVIIGYTDMLDELDGSAHATALERIRGASRELLELIEATLNLSRLESGHDAPHLEPVALGELWDELTQEFAALPRPTGVALRWEAAAGGPVQTDRRKVRIIVKNLVGNALKFTPTGEVVASCEVAPDRLTIVVRDTGVGIRADQLPVIFEMFRQVDSSDSRSYGGVGLGLHIVHRLCGQLGGAVAVASAPGRGSTFTVTLPTHEARLRAVSAA